MRCLAIGLFGFAFTVWLFAYELFGIKKCHYLIVAGSRLERDLERSGQFLSRPRELAGVINEPFASAIIYPASMAAWLYLALVATWREGAVFVTAAVFVLGAAGTLLGIRRMKVNQEREELVMTVVGAGRSRAAVLADAREQWEARCPPHDGFLGALRRSRAAAAGEWVEGAVRRLQGQHRLEPGDGESLCPNAPWNAPSAADDEAAPVAHEASLGRAVDDAQARSHA